MDSPPPEPPESPVELPANLTADSIEYSSGGTPACIYLDTKLNHTPTQCANLMRLRRTARRVKLVGESFDTLATVEFPDDDTAVISVVETEVAGPWSDTIHAAECMPDSPTFIVPRIRPMYRALTAAVGLFFLVMFPLMLVYIRAPLFATEASISVMLVVLASIGVLIVIRRWLKL